MRLDEVRKRYLDFFVVRGHQIIPSASLVPENDPTTLFTGSGMQPLLPYLLGAPHPAGQRLVNSQKCFRAEDIEEIGDNRHTTFFEMLGNWSLGDYFKQEQLKYFFEFLTDADTGVGLDPKRLYVTVFGGDEKSGVSRDEESAIIWQQLFADVKTDNQVVELVVEGQGAEMGMQNGRIFYYGARKNWWSRSGVPENMPYGEPGGPDSEVFFDFDPSGALHDTAFGEHCHPNCDCGRFMEIGNSVFMQYIKNAQGGFDELPQKNVDFGGGLERITAASNNDPDVFAIDIFKTAIREIENISQKQYDNPLYQSSFRVIIDHIRAAMFLITDGVRPGKTEKEYYARRLLRVSVLKIYKLCGEDKAFVTIGSLINILAKEYKDYYSIFTHEEIQKIDDIMTEEETKFRHTLPYGLKTIEKLKTISGQDAFILYTTYGFPFELTFELAREKGIEVDVTEFQKEMSKHKSISRAGAEKKFKGGLADHSEMTIKYHTSTHLLHQALRDVLGGEAYQKGSNITPERLRFDFSFFRKMTDEEKRQVENIVNGKIAEALPVSFEIVPIEEAKRRGAIGLFDDQYGENVKVYKIGDKATTPFTALPAESSTTVKALADKSAKEGLYSLEFCGGPHVANTSVLADGGKKFKITKEQAVSSGVRRIRAVLE